jgi:Heparinase II/III-like protein
LATLSAYLRGPGMRRRLNQYARAVRREILLETYADGGNREASTGYHLLVAQMGLHSFAVQQRTGCARALEFEARLRLMFAWMAAVADDAGKLPHLGDCDNGRVELLPDDIVQAMQPAGHSLCTSSFYALATHLLRLPRTGGQPIVLLRESGVAVLRAGDAAVVFSAMPNGLGGKGSHTHCDKLSVVFRLGANEVFCDAGSRCYTRSAELRNLDRSTKAHNTLVIDEMDQNTIPSDPRMLFQCGNEAAVSEIAIMEGVEMAVQASHEGYSCRWSGTAGPSTTLRSGRDDNAVVERRISVRHQRTVQLSEQSLLLTDEVSGTGERLLDLRFVLGPEWRASSEMMNGATVRCEIAGPRKLTLVCEAGSGLALSIQPAEVSRAYGAVIPASCILIRTTASLPAGIRTRVEWE